MSGSIEDHSKALGEEMMGVVKPQMKTETRKCSVFDCDNDATVSIPRAGQYNCDRCWEINLLKFRCPDMFEALPKEDSECQE